MNYISSAWRVKLTTYTDLTLTLHVLKQTGNVKMDKVEYRQVCHTTSWIPLR